MGSKFVDMDPSREATDGAMTARCIELSRIAVSEGEHPFGTVIARWASRSGSDHPQHPGQRRDAPCGGHRPLGCAKAPDVSL